ncbi:hypothetical protein JOM56_009025 [Amanita muscaria]
MARPTCWPYKLFFYPIGDAVATCFTSDLPPEKHAEILLLGCGDASSILYTIYADLGAQTRNLDFTCCDLEPAVLARNVLLFTLIADMPSINYDRFISKIWSIYRHPFLDEDTLDLLLKHCQRLLDFSSEISRWNGTTYGRLFRFCTARTLSSIRSHWELYVATANLPDSKGILPKEICRYPVGGKRSRATLHRSAGPLALELEVIGAGDYCGGGALPNPTFVCSAGRHGPDLYEDINPLLSFHLAKALAPLRDADLNENRSMMSLVNSAMDEFADWCRAFHQRSKLQSTSLVIRFFYGDALAFCRALRYCAIHGTADTGVYAMPWSLTVIDLDEDDYVSGDAPVQFNVIDTSNLTDHIGLLNLLIACKPLIQTNPSSVLHTNAMHCLKGVSANTAGFLKRLCGDVSLMSLILDLIPITYVSNFTTRPNVHEMMVQKKLHSDYLQGQLHEQVFWRIGSMSDSEVIRLHPLCDQRLKFDENNLANFLFDVYRTMFSDEYSSVLLPGPQKYGNDYSQVQYIRSSFAYLLRLVKEKVDVDWESFMRHFNGRLCDNPSLPNSSSFLSELFCALHLLDVHTTTPVVPPFPDMFLLKDWKDIPAVVCITIQVPRERFEALEHANCPEFGALLLMCSLVAGDAVVHQFQDYQSFFGHVTTAYPGPEPSVTFEEDQSGALGPSPVVFTFYAPSWVLDSSLNVALSIQASTDVITKLGLAANSGHIFSANITDRTHVHVTRERPGNTGEPQKLQTASLSLSASSRARPLYNAIEVVFDNTSKKVAKLKACASGLDKLVAAVKELSMEEAVKFIFNIKSVQISPQAERLSWGDFQQLTMPFPFPIDSRNSCSAMDLKFWKIELITLIRNPAKEMGTLNLFPTVKYHGSLHLWNLHYINLDRLPALDLDSDKRLAFIWPHLFACLSDRERSPPNAKKKKATLNRESSDPILRAKRNILEFFAKISLSKYNHNRVFSLADEHDIHTLIFLNDLRLDLAFHTILADVVVLPLTKSRKKCLRGPLRKLQNAGILPVIDHGADETDTIVWQCLLPAVTERCRKWEHTGSCEYLSTGVPESQRKSPICSCDQGVNLGPFEEKEEWKPFAPYSTRAAFSPLFGVPFGDTLGKQAVKSFRVMTGLSICAKCGGPGKPQLLICSSCRGVRYCSTVCQKADWKAHRSKCKNTYFLGEFPS